MNIQKLVGLSLVMMLSVSLVFADVPGGCGSGNRERTYKITFSNISSLSNHVLHLKYDYDSIEELITKDSTYYFTQGRGAPLPMPKSFFALLDNQSTDTIEFDYADTDIEINFSGISNNKLQFTKQAKDGADKLLLGMSFFAIVGLIFLFLFLRKKAPSNIDKNRSA